MTQSKFRSSQYGRRPGKATIWTRRGGGILAATGGAGASLAYWVLPVATVPNLGQITAPDLTRTIAGTSSLGFLHIVPIAAFLILVVGARCALRAPSRSPQIAATLIVLACVTIIATAYLVPYGQVRDALSGGRPGNMSATHFTADGFWVALASVALAAISILVQFVADCRNQDNP